MHPIEPLIGATKWPAVRLFWLPVSDLGPFTVLAAAYRSRGNAVTSVTFGGFIDQLVVAEWDLGSLVASSASEPSKPLD
jgi:hypothetical protein